MSDIAAEYGEIPGRSGGAVTRPSALPSTQAPVFLMSLSLSLAVALTIPSSEVREKTFRMALMTKTAWAHARH